MKPFSRRGGAKGATGPASMHLPPHIYQLFTARKNLEFKPRIKKANYKKPISGIASLISVFEKELQKAENKPKPLSNAEKKEVRKKERMSKHKENLEVKKAAYNSQKDASSSEKHTSNAYNTLFVARLNYSVDENELKEIFSEYGNLKKVVVVKDSVSGKPRGYGFVEFEHGVDMKAALRRTDGIKIKGRRILVDVERARTVKNWYPRRLGGGLGNARRDRNARDSGTSSYRARSPARERSFRDRDYRERDRDRPRDRDYRSRDYRDRPRDRENRGRDFRDRDYRDRDRGDRGYRDRDYRDRGRNSYRSRDYR
mmetsp:Transcript_11423/g.13097  ORF Transcript_11423/g.13097 Transcript_11423/m.13097 type:complete len:313 (+) Transcript_11423:138-1076(+)